MSFSENLRELIRLHGLTQKQVAKDLHMSPSTIGSYTQGIREPDFQTLRRMSAYFCVTPDYLLDNCLDTTLSKQENKMLQIFRMLNEKERLICMEQAMVFIRVHSIMKKPQTVFFSDITSRLGKIRKNSYLSDHSHNVIAVAVRISAE